MVVSFAQKFGAEARSVSRAVARSFPMPEFLMPLAAGVDISDASVKWIVLERAGESFRVENYGEIALAAGIVVSGVVQNVAALAEALADVKKRLGGVRAAHGALPEEAAYVFSMSVPHATPREQILRMIEFEFEGRVPIPPAAAVYDYSPIASRGAEHEEISVVVFPKDIAEAYVAAFEASGIALLSLEVEARSIARAVSTDAANEPVTLIVDYGRGRTGFAVLKRGIPIFTSTVAIGGDAINRVLIDTMQMSEEDATRFKREEGLEPSTAQSAARAAILPAASAFVEEIARHYRYWDTRRNDRGDRMTPVGKVILVGGHANLRGLPDFIASKVQAPVELGQCWRHVVDFDEYIPPIDKNMSLQYATAIGLALRAL